MCSFVRVNGKSSEPEYLEEELKDQEEVSQQWIFTYQKQKSDKTENALRTKNKGKKFSKKKTDCIGLSKHNIERREYPL